MKLYSQLALATALTIALSPIAASAKDLPAARKLMDAHVKAIGGAKALSSDSDGTHKGTMEIVEAGLKGEMMMAQRGTDMVMGITLPNIGDIRRGVIDGTAWSIEPQTGPRLVDGKERSQLLQPNDDKFIARDKSLIASATTTALSDSEGRACYLVEIVWKSGEKTTDCYGVDDGLLLSTESTAATPMGELKQVSHLSDYRQVGASKVAYTTKMSVAGMTQVFRWESIDTAKPADDVFAMPPAIEALVKKQSAASGSK